MGLNTLRVFFSVASVAVALDKLPDLNELLARLEENPVSDIPDLFEPSGPLSTF